ncbi:hypothetical protein CASFOL_033076 [Castilleja foliolosa]|uniref:Uncharacterized protein n=1 Tax=Castilleja foliolosa TaxID=1961234 RepID=A0ABD3C3C1_9LAMI
MKLPSLEDHLRYLARHGCGSLNRHDQIPMVLHLKELEARRDLMEPGHDSMTVRARAPPKIARVGLHFLPVVFCVVCLLSFMFVAYGWGFNFFINETKKHDYLL